MRIVVYTGRVKKTMGDVNGAYKTILALCQRPDITHVDFIIAGEDPCFGLINEQRHTPFIVPGRITLNTIFLFDDIKEPLIIKDRDLLVCNNYDNKATNQWSVNGILTKFKNIATFIPILFPLLKYKISLLLATRLPINKLLPIRFQQPVASFLQEKFDKYEQELAASTILQFFSLSTPNINFVRENIGKADLYCQYSHPNHFLSFLAKYNRLTALFKKYNLTFPTKAWFLTEYNGASQQYQINVEKIRSYQKPNGLQFEVVDTGFPPCFENESLISTGGLFLKTSERGSITPQEVKRLQTLQLDNLNQNYKKPGLFFGYVNYSCGANNQDISENPEINLEFFSLTALAQYTTFNRQLDRLDIDIIAPFTDQQFQSICGKLFDDEQYKDMELTIKYFTVNDEQLIHCSNVLSRSPIRTTPNQQNASKNKKLIARFINLFPLSPALFKHLLQISEDFTIQTGDQSFVEALMTHKISLYQVAQWKVNFYHHYLGFIKLLYERMLDVNRKDYVPDEYKKLTQYRKFWLVAHLGKDTTELKKQLIDLESFEALRIGVTKIADKIKEELPLEQYLYDLSLSDKYCPITPACTSLQSGIPFTDTNRNLHEEALLFMQRSNSPYTTAATSAEKIYSARFTSKGQTKSI